MNKMLAFEQFDEVISQIKGLYDNLDELLGAVGNSSDVYDRFAPNVAVELLEYIFNDDEHNCISYWMWEKNWGAEWDESTAPEADGTARVWKTTRQLYDFLVENMEAKERLDRVYAEQIKSASIHQAMPVEI